MAASTQISLAEYMHTSYRPDREYIDGEVVERNVGKTDHARTQAWLAAWFWNHRKEWGIQVGTEWRTRVSETRVRIPDVAITVRGTLPPVLDQPPLLIIEILSPEDTYSDTEWRTRDYQAMGVQTVWIIDPKTRSGRMCSGDSWVETRKLEVPGTAMYLNLDQLFADLDEEQAITL